MFVTYVVTMLIVSTVVAIIGGKFIFGPYVSKTIPVDPEILSNYIQIFQYSLMAGITGICYNTMLGVPMIKDKSNGNIESMLAATVSVEEIWKSKSIALFLPALIVSSIFTVAITWIMKVKYFPKEMAFQTNGWILATTFIAVPVVFLLFSFLLNLVALRYNVGGAIAIGNVFCPGYSTVFIIISARKLINPTSWLFFVANLMIGIIILIICIVLQKKLNMEKVVLSCRT